MSLAEGSKLGPYEIIALIGAGGMGEVYRAQDTRLHRAVAIKVLPQDKLADDDRKRRFLQEARAASALSHPNIVAVHDISSDSGLDFMVMEYVRGVTLRERLQSGALPFEDVARHGAQIASALEAAHAAGIVHRDIKPANLMITPEGQIKVLDFGLAKLAQPASADSQAETRTMLESTPGMILGTVNYMSPEQIRAEKLDPRTDIFSLGSVLYEAATGRLPFRGASVLATMLAIAKEEPPAPSSVNRKLPAEFDRLLGRALAKDRNDRYASAREMRDALQALEPGASVAAAAAANSRSGKKQWLLVAGLAVLAAGAGGSYFWQSRAPQGHVPNPEALELYRQGRRHIQEFTEQSFNQSIVDFQNAVKLDPDYAAAWAGLADAYAYQAAFELKAPVEVMPLAEKNATKALERDGRTAEAYTSLGVVALTYDWDWPLAEQRFRKSLALNPNDAFTQHFLGHYYETTGRWQDAVKQMQLALNMEKLSPMYGEDLAMDLVTNRRFEEAAVLIVPIAERNPRDPFALNVQALALEALGKKEQALAAADLSRKLPGMFGGAASLGGIYSRLGRSADARQILKQLLDAKSQGHFVAALEIAGVYFALGEKEKGMESLRESVKERDFNLALLIVDPVFDPVRRDPEFAALMNEIHLPPGAWRDPPRFGK
jgi:tetratricopeptide (TPR) repeat protein/tRNA A-37 threonylcarbamoyl transferase component Bud32